jgi:hypothetical protein
VLSDDRTSICDESRHIPPLLAPVLMDDVRVGVIGHRGSVSHIGGNLNSRVPLVNAEAHVSVAAIVGARLSLADGTCRWTEHSAPPVLLVIARPKATGLRREEQRIW